MTLRPIAPAGGALEDRKMTIEIKHVKTADRVSKLVAQVEGERDSITDALRRGNDGSKERLLVELANLAHELGQALHALRPSRR